MKAKIEKQDGIYFFQASHKIMGGPESGEINEQILKLIEDNEGKKIKIILDMENIGWMNSSGLGILIGTVTTLKNHGGKFALINIGERIQNLFRITKLGGTFESFPDKKKAAEYLNK